MAQKNLNAEGSNVARINIDDAVESHDEFWSLLDKVGNRFMALGMLVAFFRLCQKRFGQNKPLTAKDLETAGLSVMIETGWAIKDATGYQALGAEKHFDWYRQKIEASAKGVEARRKKRESNKNNEVASPPGKSRSTGVNRMVNPPAPAPSLKELVPISELSSLASLPTEKKEVRSSAEPGNLFEPDEPSLPAAPSFPLSFQEKSIQDFAEKVSAKKINALLAVYPKAYLEQEIPKAYVWCQLNASKAPKSDYARFLGSWIARGWETERKRRGEAIRKPGVVPDNESRSAGEWVKQQVEKQRGKS